MTGANKGDAWSEKSEQQFAGILTALLKTGGLNVQAYRIGERKLLLSTMTGWYGRDVIDRQSKGHLELIGEDSIQALKIYLV